MNIVSEHSCLLGEGPVWDTEKKLIYWIDILNGEIHEYDPVQKIKRTRHVHRVIGSFAICTDGNFIAALQNGFALIDRLSGEIKMIGDPENTLPNNRFNDGKCDPAGRFWAGTMAFSEATGAGNLYVLENNFTYSRKISNVSISNGLAWSLDRRTLYYVDTPTMEVVAYDYEETTGNISNKKSIIKIADNDGHPDGMTIDNEGMLWIAHWDGWQVTRRDPKSGQKLYSIKVPVAQVTSCTFGGEYLQDLYITTAKTGLNEKELASQPLAGCLFVVHDCGFTGLPAFKFKV